MADYLVSFIIMKNNLQSKSGIYKITINDYYVYIGQSVDIKSRWNGHLRALKENTHNNIKFQNVYNKYPDKIKFEVIEECNVDELDKREMFYIEQFNTFNTRHGLNLSIGGDSNRKYKTREEAEVAALERHKQWYENNKDRIKECDRQRYQDNKDELKIKSKQYRITHKKELKEYDKQHYQDNKEKFKESRRKRGVMSRSQRHKLSFEKRYNLSRPLTDEEWNAWSTDKSISGSYSKFYAIKFLQSLPNITFYSKITKFKNK